MILPLRSVCLGMYNVAKEQHSFARAGGGSGCGRQSAARQKPAFPPSSWGKTCTICHGQRGWIKFEFAPSTAWLVWFSPSVWSFSHTVNCCVYVMCMYEKDRGGGGGYLLYWLCRADLQPTIPHLNITQTGPQKLRAPPDPSHASTYPLWLLAVQCWLLCSPAPSKGKKGNPGFARGVTQAVCSGVGRGVGSVLQLVRYGAGRGAPGFPSLLVGVRADCTSIRVAAYGTGCHTFACSVSWACSLLWAMHFYSSFSPPKTIPCVNLNKKQMWVTESLRRAKQSSRQPVPDDCREGTFRLDRSRRVTGILAAFAWRRWRVAGGALHTEDISAHPVLPPPPPSR